MGDCLSPDGSRIAIGGLDPYIMIIDTRGSIIAESPDLGINLNKLVLSGDKVILAGKKLVAAKPDGTILWMHDLNFTADYLFTSRGRNIILTAGRINSTHSVIQTYTLEGSLEKQASISGNITGMSIDWNMNTVVLAVEKGVGSTLLLYNISSLEPVLELNVTDQIIDVSLFNGLRGYLAAARNGSIVFYKIKNGSLTELYTINMSGSILDIEYNPRIPLLAVLSTDGLNYNITYIANHPDGAKIRNTVKLHNRATHLKWSVKGSRVAAYGLQHIEVYSYKGNFLWFTSTFDTYNRSEKYLSTIRDLAWTSDEQKLIALANSSTILAIIYAGPYSAPTVGGSLLTVGLEHEGDADTYMSLLLVLSFIIESLIIMMYNKNHVKSHL